MLFLLVPASYVGAGGLRSPNATPRSASTVFAHRRMGLVVF
jgi:hypothetical protein